jgi:prepilin-type N-terminal cleavage/methylation domain-containing protein
VTKGNYRVPFQPRYEKDHRNIVEQGFTLVELLIVIVILGILAGIVVFAVGNLTNNAGANACKTEADTFATAYQAYRAQNSGTAVAGATTQAQANALKTAGLLSFSGSTLKYLSNAAGQAGGAAAAPRWIATAGVPDSSTC